MNIIPFQSQGFSIRAVEIDGEPWFVGIDVAEALGYVNPGKAVRDHCKGVTKQTPLSTKGGTQQVRIINEPDLYRLIINSQLPAADKFERWVFEDVLPTLRKTGRYQARPQASPVKQSAEAARLFPALFKVARLIGCDRNAAAISANQYVRKLTDTNLLEGLGHTHLVAENQTGLYFNPTELGQQMGGLTARQVNRKLEAAGLQARTGERWQPLDAARAFMRILDTGKRHSDGTPVQQIKWSADVLPLLQSV